MPKLRKLSSRQRQSQQDEDFVLHIDTSTHVNQKNDLEDQDHQQQGKIKNQQKERKKKTKREKSKEATQNANRILQSIQKQLAQNEETNTNHHDEIDYQIDFKEKKNPKRKGKTAKIKNKYFSMEFEDKQKQDDVPLENIELEVKKKNIDPCKLQKIKNKFESKVNKLRDRLQFKNFKEDPQYKEYVRKKLQDVADFDEENINVILEIPKIIHGPHNQEINAALFVKNSQTLKYIQNQNSEQRDLDQEKQKNGEQDEEEKKKINRKTFYSHFNQKLKEKKKISSQQKIHFRHSSLDDFDEELKKHEHLFKQDSQRSELNEDSQRSKSNSSRRSRKSASNSQKKIIQRSIVDEGLKKTHQTLPTSIKEEKQSSNSLSVENKKKKVENEERKKNKKQNNKDEKFLKKLAEQYYEQEAEVSDISGSYRGDVSEQSDNQDLSQMIDNRKVKYVEKNQRKAYQKYIESKMRQEEQIENKIREKLKLRKMVLGQDSESKERRKRRIREVKQMYEKQDGKEDEFFKQCDEKKDITPDPVNQKDIEQFNKNLENLENDLVANKQTKKNQKMEAVGKNRNSSKKSAKKARKINSGLFKSVLSNSRQPQSSKRGGFLGNAKSILGSKIHFPKRKSKSKELNFSVENDQE